METFLCLIQLLCCGQLSFLPTFSHILPLAGSAAVYNLYRQHTCHIWKIALQMHHVRGNVCVRWILRSYWGLCLHMYWSTAGTLTDSHLALPYTQYAAAGLQNYSHHPLILMIIMSMLGLISQMTTNCLFIWQMFSLWSERMKQLLL